MDTNTIAMIILFATFMIFMVLRVPVTFSMLGACVLTALYLGPKYVSSVFLRLGCLLYTSPSPRDRSVSRMPSSA